MLFEQVESGLDLPQLRFDSGELFAKSGNVALQTHRQVGDVIGDSGEALLIRVSRLANPAFTISVS